MKQWQSVVKKLSIFRFGAISQRCAATLKQEISSTMQTSFNDIIHAIRLSSGPEVEWFPALTALPG